MKIIAKPLTSKEEANANLQLSVSKLKTFEDCKAKYRFHYIKKLPRKEWEHHILGSFLHDILENFYNLLEDEQYNDFFEVMTLAFKQGVNKWSKKLLKKHKDEAFKMCQDYLSQLLKRKEENKLPEVVGIEKPLYLQLNDVLVVGYIDKIQKDYDGVLHVADYKTTKKKKYLKDFFQLKTYAYSMMLQDPNIKSIRGSYILLRHGSEYLTKEFDREEIFNSVEEKFVKTAKEIRKEKLWRPNPQFLCKYCDFLEHCKEGKEFVNKLDKKKGEIGRQNAW